MINWNSGISLKILFNPKTWGFHFFTQGGPDGYGFQILFLVLHYTYWSHQPEAILHEEDIVKSFCCDADVFWHFNIPQLKPGEPLDLLLKSEPIYRCSKCSTRVNVAGGKFID